jgi:hypothetical protein
MHNTSPTSLGSRGYYQSYILLITNETYIKAESLCELLRKIAALPLSVPITIVCDNARYQKCKLVQELADTLKAVIKLSLLPFKV